MRRVHTSRTAMCTTAGRRHPSGWSAPAVLLPVLALLGWWLIGPDPLGRGATLGILAAGWWGLGLVPVHSDQRLTGPVRRARPPADPDRAPAPDPQPFSRSR